MKKLENLKINYKKIIFRADLNVPVVGGEITDYSRVEAIIPSLKELINRKNKIFIIAHYGRPNGTINESLSISFLCKILEQKLNVSKIHFLNTIDNEEIAKKLNELDFGDVCLIENIRFYKEEETNETAFSSKLSNNKSI